MFRRLDDGLRSVAKRTESFAQAPGCAAPKGALDKDPPTRRGAMTDRKDRSVTGPRTKQSAPHRTHLPSRAITYLIPRFTAGLSKQSIETRHGGYPVRTPKKEGPAFRLTSCPGVTTEAGKGVEAGEWLLGCATELMTSLSSDT